MLRNLKRTAVVLAIAAVSVVGLGVTAGTAQAEGECWHWIDSSNWAYDYDWNSQEYYYDYGGSYCETPSQYQARVNQARLIEALQNLQAASNASNAYNPSTGYDPSTGNISYTTGLFSADFGTVLGPSAVWAS